LTARHSNANDSIFEELLFLLSSQFISNESIHVDRIKTTIIKNANISLGVLEKVVNDGDRAVSHAAKDNLKNMT
jgi:hypothetical protein